MTTWSAILCSWFGHKWKRGEPYSRGPFYYIDYDCSRCGEKRERWEKYPVVIGDDGVRRVFISES